MRLDDPRLKRVSAPKLSWVENLYLKQIVQGLIVTGTHMAGVAFAGKEITVQYPEEQHVPTSNYRGVHHLCRCHRARYLARS